jgi:hypothetical protein
MKYVNEDGNRAVQQFLCTSNQGINMNTEGKTKVYRSYRKVSTLKNMPYSLLNIASPMLNFWHLKIILKFTAKLIRVI